MVREIDLAEHTGVARAELRNLRREAVSEKHWMLFGKAIVWTDTGLKWLSERLSVGLVICYRRRLLNAQRQSRGREFIITGSFG